MSDLRCATCQSTGFAASEIAGKCEFCDGTFGGHPPSRQDIADETAAQIRAKFEDALPRIKAWHNRSIKGQKNV